MGKKNMGREPYRYIYQIKKNNKWIACGRITYYQTPKSKRRKMNNHDTKWVNE